MKRKNVMEICNRLFKAFCSTELKKNKQYRVIGENYNFKVFVDNDGRFSLLEVTQGEFNLINKLINGLPLLKILKDYKIFSINSLIEEWKQVVGYEGLYEVSNLGRIKSLNYNHTKQEKILRQGKNSNGYLFVVLCKEGKLKHYLVHRLVATAFIENTSSLPCVNHKDENKENNCVDNLEWCDNKYNSNYGSCQQRRVSNTDYKAIVEKRKIDYKAIVEKRKIDYKAFQAKRVANTDYQEISRKRTEKVSKKVYQYDKNGTLIKIWSSTQECQRNGFKQSAVSKCCRGKLKQYKGYIWSYEEINPK